MIRAALLCLCLWPVAGLAQQAQWQNLEALLFPHLTSSGRAEAAVWLPDDLDPNRAQQGLGVVYEHIPGSAGSTSIAVGLFRATGTGWQFVGRIDGLFGQSPRDHTFFGSSVELTTTMLGPNEPRCCPTLPVRWRIDLTTRRAQRLN